MRFTGPSSHEGGFVSLTAGDRRKGGTVDLINEGMDMTTVDEVRDWFRAVFAAGWNFHPEQSFHHYARPDGTPSCSPQEADALDTLLAEATEICDREGVDPSSLALEVSGA